MCAKSPVFGEQDLEWTTVQEGAWSKYVALARGRNRERANQPNLLEFCCTSRNDNLFKDQQNRTGATGKSGIEEDPFRCEAPPV
jgi:hypothetical protein